MIDMSEIVRRTQARIEELGTNAAAVSLKATGSKDTIRNWIRSLQDDGAKASATVKKINQVESVLGIELARHSTGPTNPEQQLRLALLAYGVSAEDLGRAVSSVKVFVDDPAEQPSLTLLDGRS